MIREGEKAAVGGDENFKTSGICLSDRTHRKFVVESPFSVHLRKTWTLPPLELLSRCGQAALHNRGERQRVIERES